jgi:hypothetical protein
VSTPQIAGITEQRSGRTNLDQCRHLSTWVRREARMRKAPDGRQRTCAALVRMEHDRKNLDTGPAGRPNIQQGVPGLRERTRDNLVTGSVPRLQSKMPETLDVIRNKRLRQGTRHLREMPSMSAKGADLCVRVRQGVQG